MSYVTIYHTRQTNKEAIIRSLFEEHNINFRILNEATNSAVPVGKSVQVVEDQVKEASDILKANGFFGNTAANQGSGKNMKYWMILFLALLLVILFSVLINSL